MRNEPERTENIITLQEIFNVTGTLGESFVFTGAPAYYPNGILDVTYLKNNAWKPVLPSKYSVNTGGTGITMKLDQKIVGTKLKIVYNPIISSGSSGYNSNPANLTASGRKQRFTAGGGVPTLYNFGEICWMDTDGMLYKAIADATGNGAEAFLAMCLETNLQNGNMGWFAMPDCFLRNDIWAWANIGAPLYIDPVNIGEITDVRPSASGQIVRIIGYPIASNIIWFCPDRTYIEVV
jgi:hypothetical protein